MHYKKDLPPLNIIMLDMDFKRMESSVGNEYLYFRDRAKLRLGRYFEEFEVDEYTERFKKICQEKDPEGI